MHRFIQLLVCAGFVSISVPAFAHLELTSPVSRYGGAVLKDAPCGMGDGARSGNVTTFTAGETITVEWDEYINHPGHYRIAFDADGQDDFVDPNCLSDCDSRDMVIELNTNDAVLMDGIEDKSGGTYAVDVTLPNITCDNCTLQVIQVMTDKPPYTIGGNDNYYQCADLILVASDGDMGGGDLDMGTGGTDMGGGEPDMGGGNNTTANNLNNTTGPTNNQTGQPDMGEPASDAGGLDVADADEDGGCSTVNTGADASLLMTLLLGFGLFWRRRR